MSAKSKAKTGKNKQKGKNTPVETGFLPCFAKYLFNKYPIDKAYQNKTFINKISSFIKAIMISQNIQRLKEQGGCKEVQKLLPKSSQEETRLINQCIWNGDLYRAKYGDNTMRIIFGLEHSRRFCYIFALDADHSTFNGKNKK